MNIHSDARFHVLIESQRITQALLGQLAARSETFTENPISVEQLGNLVDLVQQGTITGRILALHALAYFRMTSNRVLREEFITIYAREPIL